MAYRTCIDCGGSHFAPEDWKVRCKSCWLRRKRAEEGENEETISLRQQLEVNTLTIQYLRDELAKAKATPKQAEFGPSELRWMITRLHPDRHPEDQDKANSILRKPVEARNRLKEKAR